MTTDVDAARAKLREGFFSDENRKVKSVDVELFNGVVVELKQPTIGEVSKLARANKGETDLAIVNLLVQYCFVPGTKTKVFEPGDEDRILTMPSGPWLERLTKAIQELSGVDVEEATKNFGETAQS